MRLLGLKAVILRHKYRSYPGEIGKAADNVLNRNFHVERPNQKRVTDFTEFNIGTQKLYLSPLMDSINGEISYRLG